jgi:hypothetical protein
MDSLLKTGVINIYMFNVSMSFKGPLPECTYYQFIKLFIFYCTVNAMMICVVVDMHKKTGVIIIFSTFLDGTIPL